MASRGWKIPSGHIHEGETAEACLVRDVMEEAFVQGSSTFIGYVTVDDWIDPYWKKVTIHLWAISFFLMNIEHILSFQ